MKAKIAGCAALLLAVSAAQAGPPSGFKVATSHKGECEAMVPANFVPGFAGIGMKAPSGDTQVLISLKHGTLAEVKSAMASMFKITKTYEDGAARYWVEYSGGSGKLRHWYVLTPIAGGLCSAVLDFDAKLSEGDAKTIATTLKKH